MTMARITSTLYLLQTLLFLTSTTIAQDVEVPNLESPVPLCGDCYCVPEPGKECPGTRSSPFKLVGDQTELVNLKADNPYSLYCNPFTEANCKTTPPQEFVSLGNQAVCGVHFLVPPSARLCPKTYRLQSYPSWEEAEADGAIVTHVGACGVCSTMEDLAAYMSIKDLTPAVSKCVVKVTLFGINLPNLIECVQELGLTFDCANLLSLNAIQLAQSCSVRCQNSVFRGEAPMGPAPECALNDCITCTNEFIYPIYEAFAGRDTHRSGILAGYARSCADDVDITHEVCPKFNDREVQPTFTASPEPLPSFPPSISPEVDDSSDGSQVELLKFVQTFMGISFVALLM